MFVFVILITAVIGGFVYYVNKHSKDEAELAEPTSKEDVATKEYVDRNAS